MTGIEYQILAAYYLVLLWLVVYALHRFHLIRLVRRSRKTDRPPSPLRWPRVAIQLPVFNEPAVIRRLIRATVAVDYPGPLEIQILDDSTDETTTIIRDEIERMGDERIVHIRRESRDGYKAGALAHGMKLSEAEFFAVFDADFVPPADFLRRTMPWFEDAGIGMVQARWGHINRDESLLTRLQGLYLDAHFGVESAARHQEALYFNFNGTAGVWRREAIDGVGGWSPRTVTEDLDLSYRAQEQGWRFRFLPDLEVPAELPNTITAFHGQQFRWAKGSLQTARLHANLIRRRSLSPRIRAEATFHLTNNSAYLLTLILALLLVPSMMIRYSAGFGWMFILDALLFSLSTSSLVMFYREGQRQVGRPMPRLMEIVWLIPFGIGLSVTNARAVIEGLTCSGGVFNRTLKQGTRKRRIEHHPPIPWAELVMSAYFMFAGIAIATSGILVPLPFILLFLFGYGSTVVLTMLERFESHRASRLGSIALPEGV